MEREGRCWKFGDNIPTDQIVKADRVLLSLDEMLARVDAVSVEDVSNLAAELYAEDRLSAAAVGRDGDRFRSAIEPVSGALAA